MITSISIKDAISATMPNDYEFIPVGDPIVYGSLNKNCHAVPQHMLGKTVCTAEFWLRPIKGSYTWAKVVLSLGNSVTGKRWQDGHTIYRKEGDYIEIYPGLRDEIIDFAEYCEEDVTWQLLDDKPEKVSIKKLRKQLIATGDTWFLNPNVENATNHKLAIEKYRNAAKDKKCIK